MFTFLFFPLSPVAELQERATRGRGGCCRVIPTDSSTDAHWLSHISLRQNLNWKVKVKKGRKKVIPTDSSTDAHWLSHISLQQNLNWKVKVKKGREKVGLK